MIGSNGNLISQIILIRNNTDKFITSSIISNCNLPHSWKNKIPISKNNGRQKLQDERGILVLINRTSPFIDRFEHPKGKCYPFYKLTAYNNCNFWCEYCYLYLTFYMRPQSIHFVNYDKLFYEMDKFDRKDIKPKFKVLNLGELADPIAVDDITGFSRALIEHNNKLNDTKLMLLTKADTVDNLLETEHKGKVIISWSVNSDYIAGLFEHRVPGVDRRIAAAKKILHAGYEVRFRIDPIFKYKNWRLGYKDLVDRIFDNVNPAMITLGEYRPNKNLITHIKKRFPESKLVELDKELESDTGKKRYPPEIRSELYSHIIEAIRKRDSKVIISLCKETIDVWKACDLNHRGMSCNCTDIT